MVNETIENKNQDQSTDSKILPILPLKGTIVFPYLIVPLMIQDADQTRLVDDALMRGSRIGMFLQKDPQKENPGAEDLHQIGVSGNILKMLRFPDGSVRFLIQGLSRVKVKKYISKTPYLSAEVEDVREMEGPALKLEALSRNIDELLKKLVELSPNLSAYRLHSRFPLFPD